MSPLLVLPGQCPRSGQAHCWLPGDLAQLVSPGIPNLGLSVHLGRCRRCAVPLVRVEALAEAVNGPIMYEVRGAEL
jgi:hypothetical protein